LAVFVLTAGGLGGALIYAMVKEWRQFTLPRHLKAFAEMRSAFFAGSKTDQFDRRRGSAVFAMRGFAEESANPG
jgi:hypothetical protein